MEPFEIQGAGGSLLGFADDGEGSVTCPFDFTVVPGTEAEIALGALRESLPDMTPLVFGDIKRATSLIRTIRTTIEPNDILSQADGLDLDGWFAKRLNYLRQRERLPRHGGWPDTAIATADFCAIRQIDGTLPTHVVIGLLPCAEHSAATAYLRFGGWDDCPHPYVHVALARRWASSHGAVLVAGMSNTLEFHIARPIATREEAMDMAFIHCLYNFDIMDQLGTIELAAASLVSSRVWHFWWD